MESTWFLSSRKTHFPQKFVGLSINKRLIWNLNIYSDQLASRIFFKRMKYWSFLKRQSINQRNMNWTNNRFQIVQIELKNCLKVSLKLLASNKLSVPYTLLLPIRTDSKILNKSLGNLNMKHKKNLEIIK